MPLGEDKTQTELIAELNALRQRVAAVENAEAARRQRERELSTLVENAPDMIVRFDTDLRYVYCNVAVERQLGIPACVLLGKTPLALDGPLAQAEFITQALRQVLETGAELEVEQRYRTPFGLKYFQTHIVPERDAQGRVESLLAFSRDITTRQQAEVALRASEEKYRTVADFTHDWEYWQAPDGNLLYVSPACERITGYRPAEFQNDPGLLEAITHPADRALLDPHRHPPEASPAPHAMSFRIRARTGETRWIGHVCQPVYTAAGNYLGRRGSHRDISARKLAEARLMESEAKHRLLIENSHDIIYTLTAEGIFTFVSPAWTALLGHPASQVVGQSFQLFVHPDDLAGCLAWLRKVIETGLRQEGIEYRVRHTDGSWRWHTSSAVPLRDEAGTVVGFEGTARDITERKQAKAALEASEQQLRLIADNLPASVSYVNAQDLRYRFVNRAFVAVFGMAPEQIQGRPVKEILGEAAYARAWPYIDRARSGERVSYENIVPDRGEPHWFSIQYIPEFDAQGTVQSIIVLAVDITERKQAETLIQAQSQQLEAQNEEVLAQNAELTAQGQSLIEAAEDLRQLNAELERRVEERSAALRAANAELSATNQQLGHALRAKDEFLAAMSHELRTPLTAILGMADLLQMQGYGPLTKQQAYYTQTISQSGQHLLALITDVLDLTKLAAGHLPLELGPVNALEVCRAALQRVKPQADKKQIAISLTLAPAVTTVQADAHRLKQVLVNLLGNAVKFTPAGGQVGLAVSVDVEQRRVEFTVWDTGIGIAAEDLPRLFQDFVQLDARLARNYEGTGLGLSLVKRLVELHGGQVKAESDGLGKGSRFTVSLPGHWS